MRHSPAPRPRPSAVPDARVVRRRSGRHWVAWADRHAPNSRETADLAPAFRAGAEAFVAALREAGAQVAIASTARSPRRAYLFHWCWKIALGRAAATEAPPMPGVPIDWDHGTGAASRRGAQEMVSGFGLAVPPRSRVAPSLSSRHISGTAIDMTISWSGTLRIADAAGRRVPVRFRADVNANTALHAVGASYGVVKLRTDAPHWSIDGR